MFINLVYIEVRNACVARWVTLGASCSSTQQSNSFVMVASWYYRPHQSVRLQDLGLYFIVYRLFCSKYVGKVLFSNDNAQHDQPALLPDSYCLLGCWSLWKLRKIIKEFVITSTRLKVMIKWRCMIFIYFHWIILQWIYRNDPLYECKLEKLWRNPYS